MAHSTKIELKSLINTRDLGGLVGVDNKKIKPKRIIRSGELLSASEEDLNTLYDNYDLRTVIDLRNATEARQKPDKYLPKMKYVSIPILNEAQMGMTHEKKMDAKQSEIHFVRSLLGGDRGLDFMRELYKTFFNNEYCLDMYDKFLHFVINNKDGAILYHCSVGKDRVGIGTFFILKLLGVSQNDIEEDFMLTNEFIEPNTVLHINNLSKDISDPSLEKTYRDLFTVRKDYIETVINGINKDYGSFDEFASRKLHITSEDKKNLQDNYLE